jgi:hypothetical protein
MSPSEAAVVLAILARVDQRKVGDADAKGWSSSLTDIRVEDAAAVADAWYRTNSERPMPADIRAGVRAIRTQRLELAGEPPTAWELGIDPDRTSDYRAALYRWRRQVGDGDDPKVATAELKPRPVVQAIANVFPSPPRKASA